MSEIDASFQVELSESDIVGTGTVGGLFEWVLAFNRLRSALTEITGVERTAIRVDSWLSDLLPWPKRKKHWAALERTSGLSLPPLQVPGRLWAVLWTAAVAFALYIESAADVQGVARWAEAIVTGLFLTVFALIVLLLVTRPLHRAFPRRIKTLGDLARLADPAGASDAQAWLSFRRLVSNACGIAPEKITREMRLPEGLGIH